MGAGHKKRSDCSACREVGRRDTQTWKTERNDKDGASNRGKESIMSATDIKTGGHGTRRGAIEISAGK